MANKKIKNEIDDSFDLDDDLNFEDMGFDIDPFKDDRKPITKIKDGLIEGVKSKSSDPSFITGTLKELLPKGFGETVDLGDKIGGNIRQLYRETVDEVKPALNDFKRVASKLIPRESKYVPKAVKDILQKWEDDSKKVGPSDLGVAEQRDMVISKQLSEIFKEQVIQDQSDKAESDAKDKIQEAIELNRHKDIFGLLNRSNMSLSNISQYQTTINLQFQKKSLELQHRQLFTLHDILSTNKLNHSLQADSFNKLVYNTGLPDWQKIRLSEFTHQKSFDKFAEMSGNVISSMLPGVDDYLQMTARKIRDKFSKSIKQNVSDFRSGLTEAESGAAMAGASDAVDKVELGASVVGDEVTSTLGGWAAKKLKTPLTNKFPKLKDTGVYLQDFNENFVNSAEKFRKNNKYRYSEGPVAWLLSNIQNLLPSLTPDTTFNKLKSKDLSSVHPFTIKTDRSINEIIPGFLSKILREIQIIRTGNVNLEEVVYDHDRGRFTNQSKLLRSISSSIFNKADSDRTNKIMDSIITEIDPENKLSEKERKNLRLSIIKNKTEFQDLTTGLKGKAKDLTSDLVDKKSKSPDDNLLFNRKLNSLVEGSIDPRSAIESLISQGKHRELIQLGIIIEKPSGYELNRDKVYKMKLGQDPYESILQKINKNKRLKHNDTPLIVKEDDKTASFLNDKIRNKINSASRGIRTIKETISKQKNSLLSGFTTVNGEKKEEDIKVSNQEQNAQPFEHLNKEPDNNQTQRADQQATQSKHNEDVTSINRHQSEKARSLFSKMLDQARQGISKIKEDIKNKWKELYIIGEIQPRLNETAMKMGDYMDIVTGKIIKTIEDVRNGVKQISTDKIVLTADEINNSIIKDYSGKIHNFIDYTGQKANEYINKGNIQKAKDLFSKMINTGIKNFNNIRGDYSNEPRDVWVQGESSPRMTAAVMKEGKYIDAISGEPILTPDDIKGPVMFEGRTVVTAEDLPNLVVWNIEKKSFAPIRKLMRGLNSIMSAISWYYKKIGIPMTVYNFKMLNKAARFTVNFTRSLWGSGPMSVKDVYVGNEKEPRLYAAKIKNGEYINKLDNKPFYHHSDIKGEVIDLNGNVVISSEDLPHLQVYNSLLKIFNPLKIVGIITKGAAKAATWMMKKGLGLSKSIFKILGKASAATIGKVARYLSKPEDVFVKGEVEPRLRAVLMKQGKYVSERTGKTIELPSDIDGPIWNIDDETRVIDIKDFDNGLVLKDGSPVKTKFFDKVKNVAKKINKFFSKRQSLINANSFSKLKINDSKSDEKLTTENKTVSLLEDIKNIFEKKFGDKPKFGDTDGDGDRDGSWQDILQKRKEAQSNKKDGGPVAKKENEKDDKGGLMGMLMGALQSITGFIGGFSKLLKVGSIVKGIGGLLGLGKAGAAIAATGSAAVAGAGTALATVGAGAAAIMTSPVTLGVLGAAVAGYGAYKGYKAVKRWLSKPSILEMIRYVQYGFKKEETSNFSKIIELEDYLKKYTKIGADAAELDDKNMDIREVMSIFGMSADAADEKTQFGSWYVKRFKPVYLTHISAINIVDGSTDLSKVNSLKKEAKLKYIEASKFPSGPYNATRLPTMDKSVKASNASDVNIVIEEALKEINGTSSNSDSKSALPVDNKSKSTIQNTNPNGSVKVDDQSDSVSTKIPGASSSTSSTVTTTSFNKNLQAFDIIRYKSYGLIDLEPNKVMSIIALETYVSSKVNFDNKKATLDANPMEILAQVTVSFGVTNIANEHAQDWIKWFKNRFLPIYLNYCTLYMQETGKAPKPYIPHTLNPNKQLEIAKAISSTNGVWNVSNSPWANYMLNLDSDSISGNIEYLSSISKKETLADQTRKDSSTQQEKISEKTARIRESYWAKIPESGYAAEPNNTTKNSQEDVAAMADAEPKAEFSSFKSDGKQLSNQSPGKLNIAPGTLSEGRNAQEFLQIGSGVSLDNLNPQLLKQFYGMVEEYGTLTGKKVPVTSGHRDTEQQKKLFAKYGPGRAARPGSSLHEFGLALDADPNVLNEMDKLGLMRKYGFTRPVGAEPWHVEPAAIQLDINSAKKDSSFAQQAIENSIGRGGGGLGTINGAKKYARDPALAKAILTSDASVVDNKPSTDSLASSIKTLNVPLSDDKRSTSANTTVSVKPNDGRVEGTMTRTDSKVNDYVMPSAAKRNNDTNRLSVPSSSTSTFTANASTHVMPPARVDPGPTGPLLDFIGKKESNGNYNILVGGKTEPNLTNMTISEVLEFQKSMRSRGHESTAVGKYQIINKTLQRLVDEGYAKPDDKFTPNTQDKLAIGLLKIRGLDKFTSGKLSSEEFADNLSKEWASLPYKSGSSYYAGVGSNKSSGSREEFVNVVASLNPSDGSETGTMMVDSGFMKASSESTRRDEKSPFLKSVYNPVARPTVIKQQVVSTTRQASTGLNDAVGFNHTAQSKITSAPVNANNNTITSKIMEGTENLLAQSLDVQMKTLDVMKMIYEKINGSIPEDNKNPNQPNTKRTDYRSASYQPPSVPVPMRKA